MEKATHFFSVERRDFLKPALNEEVRSLCDLEPTSSGNLFRKNINKSLKLAQENYKLSKNLVSTKSMKKVAEHSSRAGFKGRPDREAGNSFPSRSQKSLNYGGRKKTYSSRASQFQKNIKSRRY